MDKEVIASVLKWELKEEKACQTYRSKEARTADTVTAKWALLFLSKIKKHHYLHSKVRRLKGKKEQ